MRLVLSAVNLPELHFMNDAASVARRELPKNSVVTIAATDFLDLAGGPMSHRSQKTAVATQDKVDATLAGSSFPRPDAPPIPQPLDSCAACSTNPDA